MTGSGARSRRKGHDFEREFCRWVRTELGLESFGRNLKQYGAAQEGDTDPLAGYLPECKNCARLNLKAWWGQACEQAKRKGLKPLLVYKIPRRGWRAVMPDEFAWEAGATWRYDYEYTKDVSPALLALIVREHL